MTNLPAQTLQKHYKRPDLFTAQQLYQKGFTRSRIRYRINNGSLFRVCHGVYSFTPPTPEHFAFALMLLRPDAVFEKRTAIEICNGMKLTFPLQARVSTGNVRSDSKEFSLRRSRLSQYQEVDGLRVVSAIDAVASLLPKSLKPATLWGENNVQRPITQVPDALIMTLEKQYRGRDGVADAHRDLKAMGTRAKATIKRVIEVEAVLGADSLLETTLVCGLRNAGFKPTTQFMLGGYRWDIALEKLRVVIDIDSEMFHSDPRAFVVDRWKSNHGQQQNWTCLRVSQQCVEQYFDRILEVIYSVQQYRRSGEVGPSDPVWNWHSRVRYSAA